MDSRLLKGAIDDEDYVHRSKRLGLIRNYKITLGKIKKDITTYFIVFLLSFQEKHSPVHHKNMFLIIFFSPLILRELNDYNNISYTCIFLHKDGQEFLFGKLRIRDSRYEPSFPAETRLISFQIKMNILC